MIAELPYIHRLKSVVLRQGQIKKRATRAIALAVIKATDKFALYKS